MEPRDMRMPGHKAACKCVGCSPATRRRGMAELKRSKGAPKKRRAKNPPLSASRRRYPVAVAAHKRPAARVKSYRRAAPKKRRVKNAPYDLIGDNTTLYNGSRAYHTKGRLYNGDSERSIVLVSPVAVLVGLKIGRIEYDNPAKARRAYGRAGRFTHKFTSPVTVSRVGSKRGAHFVIDMTGSRAIWRKEEN